VTAARGVNNTDPGLYLFAQRLGRAAQLPAGAADAAGLEALVRPHLRSFNARDWLKGAAAAENCVCLVGNGEKALGTGFLVGPEVVMTNFHVIRPFVEGKAEPANLSFTFDFMLLDDPAAVTFQAAPDWLIDSSPFDPKDRVDLAAPADVPADRLDYALVRVGGRPGEQPTGGDAAPANPREPRGWLKIPIRPYDFAGRRALILFHHADGDPLQMSIDTDSYAAGNGNGTRVFHRTNTEAGSSGSPCFDLEWNLVGLHQGYTTLAGEVVNRGAPMAAIRRLLNERGKLAALRA
jgi:hypothetical protein